MLDQNILQILKEVRNKNIYGNTSRIPKTCFKNETTKNSKKNTKSYYVTFGVISNLPPSVEYIAKLIKPKNIIQPSKTKSIANNLSLTLKCD